MNPRMSSQWVGVFAVALAGYGETAASGQTKGSAAKIAAQQQPFTGFSGTGSRRCDAFRKPLRASQIRESRKISKKQLAGPEQNTFDRQFKLIGPLPRFRVCRFRGGIR